MADTDTLQNTSSPSSQDQTTGINGFDEQTFVTVKNLIYQLSIQIDEVKNKRKELQQRLKNIQDNDSQLAEFEEQAKQANLAFKKRKTELEESAEGVEIKSKIKEFSEEIRDLDESLTNSLVSYFQITGTKSFDTPSGEEREFKLNAKLLPLKDKA